MSGGHCTRPTGGPAIRLKQKKKLPECGFGCKKSNPAQKALILAGRRSYWSVAWTTFSFLECGKVFVVVFLCLFGFLLFFR